MLFLLGQPNIRYYKKYLHYEIQYSNLIYLINIQRFEIINRYAYTYMCVHVIPFCVLLNFLIVKKISIINLKLFT